MKKLETQMSELQTKGSSYTEVSAWLEAFAAHTNIDETMEVADA